MARPCTVCVHPQKETIDRELIGGSPYRVVAHRHGIGPSSAFRHRRDHLTEVMAKALAAREVSDVQHGDDLLEQLAYLSKKSFKILEKADSSGDYRVALAAIREARGCAELNAKLTGELVERHAHLHTGTLTGEAATQFAEAMSSLKGVLDQLPREPIAEDIHLLEGADALPGAVPVAVLVESNA